MLILYKIYCFLTSLIGGILYVGVPNKYTYQSLAKFSRVKKHYFTKVVGTCYIKHIFFRITPWETQFRSSSISLYLLPVAWKKSPRAKTLTVGRNFNKDKIVISRGLCILNPHLDKSSFLDPYSALRASPEVQP